MQHDAQVKRVYGKLVKKTFTAVALAAILTVSITRKSSVSLLRTEHPPAAGIVPASAAFEEGSPDPTQTEQMPTTPIEAAPQRLPRMRREAKRPEVPKAARPEAWGSVMRKEQKGSAGALAAPKAKPEAWGSLMRKEARATPPVVASTVDWHAAAVAPTFRGAIGMLVALTMLVGFAVQVKSTVSGLLRASGLEDVKGKGK